MANSGRKPTNVFTLKICHSMPLGGDRLSFPESTG